MLAEAGSVSVVASALLLAGVEDLPEALPEAGEVPLGVEEGPVLPFAAWSQS